MLQHPRHDYAAGLHHGLRHRHHQPMSEFPARKSERGRDASQPRSTRFELVPRLRSVTTLVPHVCLSVSLTGPAPSGSTGTSRRCQGCSHPHPRHGDQAALSFSNPPRRIGGSDLASPPINTAPRGARRTRGAGRRRTGWAARSAAGSDQGSGGPPGAQRPVPPSSVNGTR